MIKKFLVPSTAILTLILSASCSSPQEPTANADTCQALTKQFDAALADHGNAAKLEKAKQLRADGGKKCDVQDYEGGTRNLRRALKRLGVKPSN